MSDWKTRRRQRVGGGDRKEDEKITLGLVKSFNSTLFYGKDCTCADQDQRCAQEQRKVEVGTGVSVDTGPSGVGTGTVDPPPTE